MKTHIVLHHSLTADGRTFSWGAIRRYHMGTNKWQDIGYHYGVELIEYDYEVLVGRPEQDTAAACREGDMNRKGIHVCCVGNFDLTAPPEPLLAKLTKYIVAPLVLRHKIPFSNIVGHRDYATYKSCPGKLFDINALRGRVVRHLTGED